MTSMSQKRSASDLLINIAWDNDRLNGATHQRQKLRSVCPFISTNYSPKKMEPFSKLFSAMKSKKHFTAIIYLSLLTNGARRTNSGDNEKNLA